jgi:hypothetical protein
MTGKIFINYRRGDDPGNTGRLFDGLQDVFEPRQLFIDVDSIAPGLDFVRVLDEHIAQSDVLLAVIGKGWLDARDATGARRLDNPDDFVRIEIASALKQGKRVIPVLVGDAQMPRSDELPEELRPLARRNAVRLTYERFRADLQGFVKALKLALDEIDGGRNAELAMKRRTQAEEEGKRTDEITTNRIRTPGASVGNADPARAALRPLDQSPRRLRSGPAIAAAGAISVLVVASAVLFWVKNAPVPVARPQSVAITEPPKLGASVSPSTPPPVALPVPGALSEIKAAPAPAPDEAAWSVLKDTTDQQALKRFVAQYPDSSLRPDADARIAVLAAAQAEKAAAPSPIDAHELARLLQLELKRVGCFAGDVNGEFDDATKIAWQSFTRLTSIGRPDDAAPDAIKAVRGIDKRVCPLVCPAGGHAEGDLCVIDAPPPKSVTTEPVPAPVAPAPKSVATEPAPAAVAPAPKRAAAPRGHGKCFNFEGRQFCE